MPPVGDSESVWREAGEWWNGEPYREIRRFVDEKGIRREEVTTFESLGDFLSREHSRGYSENNREEWSLRPRKIRDEKVARACGWLPKEEE